MQIELWDEDVPYILTLDSTDDGKDIIKIQLAEGNTDLNLDKDHCKQLIRVLTFMLGEFNNGR